MFVVGEGFVEGLYGHGAEQRFDHIHSFAAGKNISRLHSGEHA